MNRIVIIMCVFLAACTGAEHQPPIPRPKAYPRPALYPTEYRTYALPCSPDSIAVNSSAIVDSLKPGWFNIEYPTYNITINCTLTTISPQSFTEVLENRRERMTRNLEGSYGEMVQWDGTTIIVAPSARRTPVQFLATDSATYVLSGVAVGNYPTDTSVDSITPYVNAVAADITYMLKQL